MAYIEIKLVGGKVSKIPLKEGENLIGSSNDANIKIDDPLIDPKQAIIIHKENYFKIKNLSEQIIFYKNGSPIKQDAILDNGDDLIFGSTKCRFYSVETDETREFLEISYLQDPEQTISHPIHEEQHKIKVTFPEKEENIPTEDDLQKHPFLRIRQDMQNDLTFLIKKEETTIGKDPSNDITINHPSVDPRHGKIVKRHNELYIVDMDSENGTFLDGKRILREKLKDNAILKLGQVEFIFHLPMRPVEEAVITSQKLKKKTKTKLILTIGITSIVLLGIIISVVLHFTLKKKPTISKNQFLKKISSNLSKRNWKIVIKDMSSPDASLLDEAEKNRFLAIANSEKQNEKLFQREKIFLEKGNLENAISIFFKIPTRSSYHKESTYFLIRYMEAKIDAILKKSDLSNADFSKIATLGEKILEVKPQFPQAYSYICMARLGQNNYREALKTAQTLMSKYPSRPEGYFYSSAVKYKTGDYKSALSYINEAMKRDPLNIEYMFLRSKTEIMLGRFSDAKLDLSKVIQADPSNNMAKNIYRKLTGKEPLSNPRNLEEKKKYQRMLRQKRLRLLQERQINAARQFYINGNAKKAISQIDKLCQEYPTSKNIDQWITLKNKIISLKTLYEKGKDIEKQNMDDAIAIWEKMFSLESQLFPGRKSTYLQEVSEKVSCHLVNYAMSDFKQGQIDRAYILSQRSLKWNNTNNDARMLIKRIEDMAKKYYREGFRHYQHGDPVGARQYWIKVTEIVSPDCALYKKATEKLSELGEQK